MRLGGGGLRELASGVDGFYLSGRAALSAELLERLARQREVAEGTPVTTPFVVGQVEFRISPRAWGKHRFCLEHRHGRVGLTPSASLPAVRVQPRAEFLHGVGPRAAIDWFDEVLSEVCGPIRWTTSRLDLHADFQGWELEGDDRHRFRARADLRNTHEVGHRFTGFEFGRRSTKTVAARIYDKVEERRHSGLGYLEELWSGYVPGEPVLRVEFEFGREGLRQFDIDSPKDALDAAPALWLYATSAWLTYRSPTDDTTPSRWPIAPEWSDVQRATLGEDAAGLHRLATASRRASLRKLLPALVGYLATTAVHLRTSDIEDTCRALPSLLHDYEQISGTPFARRVEDRRIEAGFR